jgi:hypothetical protein
VESKELKELRDIFMIIGSMNMIIDAYISTSKQTVTKIKIVLSFKLRMRVNMKDLSKTIRLMDRELFHSMMEELSPDLIKIIKDMALSKNSFQINHYMKKSIN